jgi:hypothetical protein
MSENHKISSKKKILFYFITYAALFISFALCAELILRYNGFKPWIVEDVDIQFEPNGHFYKKDPNLGYTHLPGKFRVIFSDSFAWTTTHLDNTLRITHPIETYGKDPQKKQIWIFGCSFTHGWSLNDNETFPWLLQEAFPNYEIVNFGTGGYGTLHSLIQFKRTLQKGTKPLAVVIAYSSFHDERNTFLRSRRKDVAPWYKLGEGTQPYARLDKAGKLHFFMAETEFQEFPLMRYSALMNYLETKYDQIEDSFYHSREVTQAIIKQFAGLCKNNEIKFVVAAIVGDPSTLEMLDYLKKEGILTTDISVDLGVRENTNLPHDGHPSFVANKQYAQKLGSFLKSQVLNENL